ncbi:glutamate receptor ionotropic, kainate glr-3-like [Macrosteles quadrilineatus]|uniref:glutamate receptor ionotropic, kainate glr-3-like n=1 Tax=Macrosteles quadrilineatus TaxID=74068 RepID=UPI0023E21046|nr:glutamate receptor ionotropic, kainate glr-3-like [Macrosteles quadrilineatus]
MGIQHNTKQVSFFTCWTQVVTMKVALAINRHGMMQSWSLDITNLPENYYEVLVIDLSCPGAEHLLILASHVRKFTLRNIWLLFDFSLANNTSGVLDAALLEHLPWFNNLNILPDSKVFLAISEEWELVSVYRMGRGRPMLTTAIGTDRSNLEGTKLIGSTVLFHPELFRGFYSDYMPDVDTWPKLHYPVVINLAHQLNFDLELWAVDDYGWETNGSFTGLMGQLQRRDIDFAATGFFMRADRIRVVDFTAETYHIRTTIMFRQPSLSSVSNIFLLPFATDVWVCCFTYCILVIFIFSIEIVASRHFGGGPPMMGNTGFMDIVTLVLGCVCQQGSHIIPEKMSGRVTLFFLSLTSLFFFTSYSANIVALLQSPSSALATLTDLVNSPLFIGIQDLQYNRIYFKESNDPATRMLYEKKVKPFGQTAYYKPEEGIRKVRKDLFAFNVETNLGYKMISETFLETEKCALSELQLFPMPMLAIPLTKRSGYRELFAQKVRWQRETGILHRHGKLWLPQRPQCEDVRGGTGFVSVGLKEFLPALKVLSYGLTLAFVVMILEILYHYRKKILLAGKV